MIDTHAHLHVKQFDRDRAQVIDRAWRAGLRAIVEVNIDATGWLRVEEMAAADPRIFVSVGIHPHDTGRSTLAELETLLRRSGDAKVRAIGETGLDYYRDYAPHDVQRDFFRRQVAFAREARLPLIVHSRAAHDDVLSILEEEGRGEVAGVMHCFSGDLEVARRSSGLGFLLGFGGAITYNQKRSEPLLRSVGLAQMVLETDCPYLAPHPRRNERNEPARIPEIASALAAALGVEVEEVERVTDANARRLFNLTP